MLLEEFLKIRLLGFASAVALALGGGMFAAAPAQAAGPAIQFSKVYYDSPGSDTGSNSSLNAEYVRLTNKRTYSINLKGWSVRDKTGYTYRFGSDFRLGAGASVYIHTGKGTNSASHRYWGRTWYVWNNGGDTAWVKNPSGTTIDTCAWTSDRDYTYC